MLRINRWSLAVILAAATFTVPGLAQAQWAARSGETVRNLFGPERADGRPQKVCRGACGSGCPSSCTRSVRYECVDSSRLRRVKVFECGSHQGCREHDDCLDACTRDRAQGTDCDSLCHSAAVNDYGLPNAGSWLGGGGPFDGPPITFEYTLDQPGAPEAAYRCPEGAALDCDGSVGRCLGAEGEVAPVFDAYPSAVGMKISNFRAGLLCGDSVCGQTDVIQVTGEDTCPAVQGTTSCTRYAMEFDYRGADPSAPLECSVSTTGGGDDSFVGNLIKQGLDAMPEQGDDPEDGLGQLLGVLQQVVGSADNPEDVQISMAPLGPDGRPIESERVGNVPRDGPPPIPTMVELAGAEGHVVVPMYQSAEVQNAEARVREIRCSHKGVPVVETAFHLRFGAR